MRISDWSSDVCSSDLLSLAAEIALGDRQVDDEPLQAREASRDLEFAGRLFLHVDFKDNLVGRGAGFLLDFQLLLEITERLDAEIGRASGRERGCLYVWISGVAVSLKKKKKTKR